MQSKTKVIFFIPPGVHLLDLSGPVQAFFAASQKGGPYSIGYCSFKAEMQDSTGLHFCRLDHYSQVNLRAGDYLFIPGFSRKLLYNREFREQWEGFFGWLRQQAGQKVHICSVCLGSFILARAGLLDGRKCTTHWDLIDELRQQHPAALVQDDVLFVKDETIYSSAGISSGIDLALFILEERHGPLFAHKIARELVVYSRRGGHHTQESIYLNYRNHVHPGIHTLQDWLIDNLGTRATIEDMAERVHMSSRNLTRTFKLQTGISIHQYVTMLRLELASNLRNTPGITVNTIARQCGFENERQLQRIWKKR